MLIRPFEAGEEAALRTVFFESVHGLARFDYSASQLDAWAPAQYDTAAWAQRMRERQPQVALIDGRHAGYADLQSSGYIDMFFVSPHFARRGVASALMHRLLELAREAGLPSMYSNVSLTAQAFFAKHGFVVERHNQIAVRGAVLTNATMRRSL